MLRKVIAVLFAVLLVTSLATPAAAQGGNTSEPLGPGFLDDDNDSSIVDDVTPDFLGDLMKSLPAPNFVKEMFN